MRLHDGENFLEIIHTETSPANTPMAGDMRLIVRLFSGGFAGSSESVWAGRDCFRRFLTDLQALEELRHGVARLEAIGSPDEFWMEFRSIDRSGHLAVFGRLSRWQFLSTGAAYHQAVEFAFEFCPSELPIVLQQFKRMGTDIE